MPNTKWLRNEETTNKEIFNSHLKLGHLIPSFPSWTRNIKRISSSLIEKYNYGQLLCRCSQKHKLIGLTIP